MNQISAFAIGFLFGSSAASVIAVLVMAALTSGKVADMQDKLDELELERDSVSVRIGHSSMKPAGIHEANT